jgi:OOP family OmpA-OmpF porin
MKMKQLHSLTLGLALSFSAFSAGAAEGQLYLVPGVQWMDFDDFSGYDNDIGYFIGLGYDISERISAEFSVFDLDPEIAPTVEEDIDAWKVDGFYNFDTDWGRWQPFVVTGLGNTNFDGDNELTWDLGVGVKYQLADNLYWRIAARNYAYMDRPFGDSDVGVDTGILFYFGGNKSASSSAPSRSTASPAPAAASPGASTRRPATTASEPARRTETPIADADQDGVADARDRCPETPRNYAVDENGCPIPVEEVARVELVVNFDFDRSEVKAEYFDEIEEVAEFMRQYEDTVVELEGHTDSRGTDQYNQGLSERRANAVRQVMIDRFGISAGRITATGYGESQPIASNSTDAGRAENRRVITVVIKTLQNYQPR